MKDEKKVVWLEVAVSILGIGLLVFFVYSVGCEQRVYLGFENPVDGKGPTDTTHPK